MLGEAECAGMLKLGYPDEQLRIETLPGSPGLPFEASINPLQTEVSRDSLLGGPKQQQSRE